MSKVFEAIRPSRNVTLSLMTKAVKSPENVLRGVMRITKSAKPPIKGLSVNYEIINAFSEIAVINFSKNNAFFYGSEEDLKKFLTLGNQFFINLDLKQYEDRQYHPSVQKYHQFGALLIPLQDMQDALTNDPSSQKSITWFLQTAEEKLPGLTSRLESTTIQSDDPNFMKGFSHSFSFYPRYLKDLALEAGEYYSAEWSKSNTIYEKPSGVIITTPMGGLPDWAKRERKRH